MVTAVATIAACGLYAVQIASGISVRNELRQTCDPHPPLEIAQYFWVTILLSAVGLVAAVVAIASASRRAARFAAAAPILVCGALFLLGWYGFTTRNDWLGPLCSNL